MVEQSKPTDIKATSATKPEVEEKSAPESGIEKKVQSETSSTGADRPNSNATTAVNKPEVGLVSQEGLPEGGVRLEYNPDQRPDRLKEATKRSIQGGEELTKKFDGRSDGLEAERVLVKGSVTEQEVKYEQGKGRDGLLSETKVTKDGSVKFEMRTFDPAKNPQHQSCETVTRDGSITTTARAFEGRKDGLKLETVTEDGPGLRRTRQFADGSVEVSRKGEDGLWRGTRTRAGVTLSTLELPNGATMLQSDKGIEIRTANGKSTYSLEKQPGGVKLTIDGNSWSSTDGKTFKNGTESFEATLLPNGDLRRNFKDRVPPESEIRRTDGSILVVDSQDKLLSATSKDGVTFKLDAQQRIIQSQKGDVTTNFQYDGQSQTPSSFTVGERKFEIVKAGDKSAFVVTTKGDGSETLPQIDDTLHPAFKGATVRVEGEDGRLNAVVRPNGDRIQYGYTLDAKQHAMGRADQPSQITKYSNEQVEKWVTADGVKWEQLNADGSKNGNTWEGIKTLDQKTGQMTETAMVRKDGALKTVTTATKIDGTINADVRPSADQEAGKPAVERSVNLDVRLKEIKQAADPSQWFSTEKADVIRRQLKDLSPEEIQLLKRAYDPSNPNAFGDFLKQQFERLPEGPYGLPPGGIEGNAHRWAEVEGQLKRNGQPGEETAIQLKVDALEARYAGFYGNRSIEAIQQNTRLALLGTTEEQRTQVESALGRLYENNGLSKFYQSGDGANLTRGDAFTKSVIDLTSRKGVDARTPSEQSDLLKVALRTQDIKKFREVSAKEAMTADGRKYFAENGGINAIDEKRASGRALAYVFGPEIRAELKELARFGEESPLTQFKKGIGIFSNVDSALQDAVKRTANNPEWRARYLDGRELARSGATPQTEEQKQALDYYKEWQKVFQSAHIFGADRSATNYEAQIVSPDGALASGQLFQQGGEWFQNASDLFKVVEGASNEQLNVLLNGARVNAGTDGTATAQSDGLTDAIKALDLSINNGTNRERLDKLIADKVKYAVELSQLTDKIADSPPNQPVDENAIAQFKKMVPAFKDVPADKMQSILQGYRLDRALREGRLNPDSISDADRQSILAFRKLGEDRKANPTESKLHDFLKGRESQRHIDKIMQDNSLSAGTKDRQVSDYLKSMGDLDRLSLDSFRQQRNDAIQSNVRRDLKDAIADAKDQQALVAAVKNATVQEQERFRNDPQYQQEIRDLVKRYT